MFSVLCVLGLKDFYFYFYLLFFWNIMIEEGIDIDGNYQLVVVICGSKREYSVEIEEYYRV